jgi:hypothetical protein
MIAKLRACQDALDSGVDDVVIVDGRDPAALVMTVGDEVPAAATRLVAGEVLRGADHLRQGFGGPP